MRGSPVQGSHSKIRTLTVPSALEEDIFWLQVPMAGMLNEWMQSMALIIWRK